MGWIERQKEKLAKFKTWLPDIESESDEEEEEEEDGDSENEVDVTHSTMSTNGTTENVSNGLNKLSNGSDNRIPMESIPKVIYASRTHTQIFQGSNLFITYSYNSLLLSRKTKFEIFTN